MSAFKLGVNHKGVKSTVLTSTLYNSFEDFSKEFLRVNTGVKDGSYFVRCEGNNRTDLANYADVLILDCDFHIDNITGEVFQYSVKLETIHNALKTIGVNHFVYSSYSSTQSKPKCRVVIECHYARGELKALLKRVFASLEGYSVHLVNVKENAVWGQPWYFPRCPARQAHLYRILCYFDGKPLEVEQDAQDWHDDDDSQVIYSKAREKYRDGKISPIWAFNQAYPNPTEYLETQGYVWKGRRMLHPASSTGIPSLQVCNNCKDGVTRVYSHGSDALNNGYAHDSFDCFMLIECDGRFDVAVAKASQMVRIEGLTLRDYELKEAGDIHFNSIGEAA